MKLLEALPDFSPRLLESSEGRRLLTKHDPLMFAAIYLPHKLRSTADDPITLNAFHLDVLEYAKSWSKPLSAHTRHHDCFIAPRMTGKSTWIFHILPIWAGAHHHKRYLIAFADSDTQCKQWLMNFKTEVNSNILLQEDYPEFCDLARQGESARAYQDNRNITKRGNGFIFQVAGADSNVLGANVDGIRPEIILFDDIEPTESNYSEHEARKRLNTVLSSHFYLNPYAIKAFIGTTTMPDSIIDQIRKVGEAKEAFLKDNEWDEVAFRNYLDPMYRWVVDNQIECHYWPAIMTDDDGDEYSLWPERWTMDWLNSQRHTREFAMNMQNRPVSLDGGYWGEEDIIVDEPEEYGNTIISVDPAVTTKRTSDYTGICVASRGNDGKIYIRHAEQVKYTADVLKEHIESIIKTYDAKVVYIETNQGGDLWKQVFSGISARLRTMRVSDKKELRAARAHDIYRKGKVAHVKNFPALQEQMLAFPRVPHDDVLDSVVAAVLYFNQRKRRTGAAQINYMED